MPRQRVQSAKTKSTTCTMKLQTLQKGEIEIISNVFEHLRQAGIENEVVLPRLVTGGDTSAGKSSVLERLTGIPFPSGDGVVTRFALEVVQRPASEEAIDVTIIPDKNRPSHERILLSRFKKTMSSTSAAEFNKIYKDASKHMGLDAKKPSLVGDRLRIEASGPDRPPLTVIDIPGLIQATTKGISPDDLKLSHNIVNEYLKQPRTIILAIVSADNDVVNQAITQKAREVDPDGKRTMGIITKPDALAHGSAKEKQWMELAQNSNISLELGWHVLVNKVNRIDNATASEISSHESNFFRDARFAGLPTDSLGIEALLPRLQCVAHKHLVAALPELQCEFQAKLNKSEARLAEMGYLRADTRAQRTFLTSVAKGFETLARIAVDGSYSDSFFRSGEHGSRMLRAQVQNLNDDFARGMRLYGATRNIKGLTTKDSGAEDLKDTKRFTAWVMRTKQHSKESALEWIRSEMRIFRGPELAGSVNSGLVKRLFSHLSQEWESLTVEHVERVQKVCEGFVADLLPHVTGKDGADVRAKLKVDWVDPQLKAAKQRALKVLDELCEDNDGTPITHDPLFVNMVKEAQDRRSLARAERARIEANMQQHVAAFQYRYASQKSTDEFTAENTLDLVVACYSALLTRFVDNVAVQVVERNILQQVPKLLTTEWVARLGDEELKMLAEESMLVQKERREVGETRDRMLLALQRFEKDLGVFTELAR